MGKRYILLDNIRSLFNVGAIFRTCDGAGFDGLYCAGFTPFPPRKEISKTALGAEMNVPWEYYEDPLVILEKLKKQGCKIVVCEQTAQSKTISSFFPEEEDDICLVVGNEIEGVQPQVTALADICVDIPMRGKKQSLNVAVAAGICMYQLTR